MNIKKNRLFLGLLIATSLALAVRTVPHTRSARQFLHPDTWMCEPNKEGRMTNLHWDRGQHVLAVQSIHEDALGWSTNPDWQSCNVPYLKEVAKRRDEAMRFVAQEHPNIVFVGVWHGDQETNSVPGANPEGLKRLKLHHDTTVKLVREDPDVDVFVFEGTEGSLEPITRSDLLTRLQNTSIRGTDGQNYPPEFIFTYSTLAWHRIIDQRPDVDVIPGEECLGKLAYSQAMRVETRLVETGESLTRRTADCRTKIYSKALEQLQAVRTEVIIIRVLEALQRKNGNKAVIEQGRSHLEDFPAIQSEYGFSATTYDLVQAEAATQTD
jgi:hypothetical protein